MNPLKPRVRTDYHELFSSSDSAVHEERVNSWFKSVLLVGFGFILGVMYSKTFVSSGSQMLALSSVPSAAESVEVNITPVKNQRTHSKA